MATFNYAGHSPDRIVIRSLMHRDDSPAGRELDRLSKIVMTEARRRVGVRTGTLISTISRESGEGPRGRYIDIVAGVRGLTPYLGYHMDGTWPHIIRARRRKALRFVTDGGLVVFRRYVKHPGTQANPFLRDALRVLG